MISKFSSIFSREQVGKTNKVIGELLNCKQFYYSELIIFTLYFVWQIYHVERYNVEIIFNLVLESTFLVFFGGYAFFYLFNKNGKKISDDLLTIEGFSGYVFINLLFRTIICLPFFFLILLL